MEYVDLEKLEKAIIYVQRIADGRNPVNNLPAEEDSVLNNPNVIRCMFFVKEILEDVQRNGGCIGKKQNKKAKQVFPVDLLGGFKYKEDLPISKLTDQINDLVDTDVFKKISYNMITKWLRAMGYMDEVLENGDKTRSIPTEKGNELGIYTENRTSIYGRDYVVVLYNKNAQEYIVNNMGAILDGEVI